MRRFFPIALSNALSLLVVTSAAVSAAAEPPSANVCAAAYESAQRFNRDGRLIAARDQFAICGQEGCPAFLSRECTTGFDRLSGSIPTVTLTAKDAQGSPLVDVSVIVDGQPLVDQLAGRAIPVDPGLHEFKFELDGYPPIVRSVMLGEGDKNRRIEVQFGRSPSSDDSRGQALPGKPARRREVPTSVWIVGGLGVAALGAGTAFRIVGSSQYDELSRRCSPNCTESEIDDVEEKYIVSSVALGIGAGALVTAGIIYLLNGPSGSSEPRTARWTIQPFVSAQGTSATFSGVF